MGKTSSITPLSRQCFTVSNAAQKLFQALDLASIICLSLPHFLSFWNLQAVTTSSQGKLQLKRKAYHEEMIIYEVVPPWPGLLQAPSELNSL